MRLGSRGSGATYPYSSTPTGYQSRKVIVGDDVIELCGWLVVPGTPSLPAVHTNGGALIHGESDDLWVLRIDPDGVIVITAGRSLDGSKADAAIGGAISGDIGDIDCALVFGINPHTGEIVATPP